RIRHPPRHTLFPYTTLFRSAPLGHPASARRRTLSAASLNPAQTCRAPASDQAPTRARAAPSEASRETMKALTFKRYGKSPEIGLDRKSTRLNSSHVAISYAV